MRKGVPLGLALVFLCAVFFIFTYNSGYGYDALEYLVIGRSLLEGYRLYDFIPSKSCGLYYLVAAFLSTGLSSGHFLVTAITTLIFATFVCITYWVVRHTHSPGVAVASSLLVALCSVFMELNYLEPEGLVAVCGLGAFLCIFRAGQSGRNRYYLLGGLFVGFGFVFKSVAGFYFIAILIFVLIQELRDPAKSVSRFLSRELLVIAGLVTALILPMIFFGLTGRLAQHLEWTYFFPLFHRPVETLWISKLFTKLLWFDVLLVAALATSLRRGIRQQVYSRMGNLLALLMGLCSLLALFKQQASHYVFPGAVFLSIFIADVFHEEAPGRWIHEHRLAASSALAALAILLAGSVWLYSPRALQRLVSFRNYSDEYALSQLIQKRIPEDKNALFFKKSTLLYWLSNRYPNIPFLKMDVQETYALQQTPDMLLRALSDPNLVLVECDPKWMGIQDANFFNGPGNRELIDAFLSRLRERFALSDAAPTPYLFWNRKEEGIVTP